MHTHQMQHFCGLLTEALNLCRSAAASSCPLRTSALSCRWPQWSTTAACRSSIWSAFSPGYASCRRPESSIRIWSCWTEEGNISSLTHPKNMTDIIKTWCFNLFMVHCSRGTNLRPMYINNGGGGWVSCLAVLYLVKQKCITVSAVTGDYIKGHLKSPGYIAKIYEHINMFPIQTAKCENKGLCWKACCILSTWCMLRDTTKMFTWASRATSSFSKASCFLRYFWVV